jgi:hypothetical protein
MISNGIMLLGTVIACVEWHAGRQPAGWAIIVLTYIVAWLAGLLAHK